MQRHLALFLIPALASHADAQCTPAWSVGFGPPGTSGPVHAIATLDRGAGPEVIIAGAFLNAGGVGASRIARWDGLKFQPLSSGLPDLVRTVCPFDPDGPGPLPAVLFAGGNFSGQSNHIAQWDGLKWTALGQGVDNAVRAIAVFDDGTGPAIFAGGDFLNAGGILAAHIAKWDGARWAPLGIGVNDSVYALAVFDDGSGPALFAGGTFTNAGGAAASRMARWDGAAWSALGSGTSGPVAALAVFNDGSGDALYGGGAFNTAGGKPASRIARWDGLAWSALGSGVNDAVYTLHAFDDGTGPALLAGGLFTTAGGNAALRIARWEGLAWSPVGAGTGDAVRAIGSADLGVPTLYAGGDFPTAADGTVNYVAQWRDSRWLGLGNGANSDAQSVAAADLGDGPTVYIGGSFTSIGGVAARSIAAWNGDTWAALGSGCNGEVHSLLVFDDGETPALYAAGAFDMAGGKAAKFIAKWDGQAWNPVGSGLPSASYALAVFDDGTGDALFAGGQFGVRMWNGQSWVVVGGDVNHWVEALAVFDDGAGDALYVGGRFSMAGNVTANHIAKWNGSSWSRLGDGLDETVWALVACPVAGGISLYAGGQFNNADGLPAARIAKWNGLSWSPVGSGMADGDVYTLAGADLGDGAALYAGGSFDRDGGGEVNFIARWDGSTWSKMGSGADSNVHALAPHTQNGHTSLYAAGGFSSVSGIPSAYIARWSCPPPPPPLDLCESAHLFGPGAHASDFLGQSVSIYGDTLIAGAFGDDTAGEDAGAAYLFGRANQHWSFLQTLIPADANPGDFSGSSVAISGLNAIVGAPRADPAGANSGAAAVFRLIGGVWLQEGTLVPDDAAPGDQFGLAVSLFGDSALVGAWRADLPDKPNAGAAYLFARQNGNWVQIARLKAIDASADDNFGASVALSKDYAIIGAPGDDNFRGVDAGAAYQFHLSGGQWTQVDKIVPNDLDDADNFGVSVACDNVRALIGAPGSDLAAADAGAAIVFRLGPNGAAKEAVVRFADAQPGDVAGSSVAIVGNLALVGAPLSDRQGIDSGAATLFQRDNLSWTELATVTGQSIAPGDALGSSVAIGPDALAAGAIHADGPAGPDQGAVLAYSTDGCPCYPDFAVDGALDLFDFLAFVNAFNAQEPTADCDHDQTFTLFDFLCFTNAFNAGC